MKLSFENVVIGLWFNGLVGDIMWSDIRQQCFGAFRSTGNEEYMFLAGLAGQLEMMTPKNGIHEALLDMGFISDNDPNGNAGYTHIAGKGFIYVDEKTTLHDIPVLLWKDGFYNGRHEVQMKIKMALEIKGQV